MSYCELCQKPIIGRQKTAKYCTNKCSSLAAYYRNTKEKRFRKNKEKQRKRLEGLACKVCGSQLKGKQKDYCGTSCKSKAHYGSARTSLKERAHRRKKLLVEHKGGKCSSPTCSSGGYDKNLAALCFHHRDEQTKGFELSIREIGGRRWDAILAEAEKCDLLCHNCHMETHYPQYQSE